MWVDRSGTNGYGLACVEKCGGKWGKVWHAGLSQPLFSPFKYVTLFKNSAGIFSRLPHSSGPIVDIRLMCSSE